MDVASRAKRQSRPEDAIATRDESRVRSDRYPSAAVCACRSSATPANADERRCPIRSAPSTITYGINENQVRQREISAGAPV